MTPAEAPRIIVQDVLIDARGVGEGPTIEADLCVIGAGAAGITLVRELLASDLSICLLESGGLEEEAATDALNQGASSGTLLSAESGYVVASRQRYFGGTTNHWQGECRPLDPIDFEVRDWVPHSGWPFPRAHLEPYYARACRVVECAPFPYDLEARVRTRGPLLFEPPDPFETTFFHKSPPTRFGQAYRAELVQAGRVRVLHHANVVEIERSRAAGRIDGLRVACLAGNRFRVQARCYVLATGGIENARLLLASDGVETAGLGNGNGLVGRFFMDHLVKQAGFALLPDRGRAMGLYQSYREARSGQRIVGALRSAETLQRSARLLNTALLLPGATRDHPVPQHAAITALAGAWSPPAQEVKGRPRNYHARVEVFAEPRPDPASRVTLGEERDALGMRRVQLDWRLSEEDAASIRATVLRFARELGRRGLGRVSLIEHPEGPWTGFSWGSHHLGTTRMHEDPRQGVVDRDGRVHGLENLFVAGSSLFPTAGCSNPTLTIVALALRLAEHLRTWLGAPGRPAP